MHLISVNTGSWIGGSNTEIRVEFDDDAKLEADRWSGPAEKMIDRCFWRLISVRWDEVFGETVTFRMDRATVKQLVKELHELDAADLN